MGNRRRGRPPGSGRGPGRPIGSGRGPGRPPGSGRGRGRPPGSGRGRGRPPGSGRGNGRGRGRVFHPGGDQTMKKRSYKKRDPYDLPISNIPLSIKNRRGECYTIVPITGKGRCSETPPYHGRLFPAELPEIPPNIVGSDKRIAIHVPVGNGQVVERYLTHSENTNQDIFKMAYDYAGVAVDTHSLPKLIREHAILQQRFPNLPEMVESFEGNIKISRLKWLTQGVSVTRPASLSEDQMEQLRRASYWASQTENTEHCNVGKTIEDYYYHVGHQMEQRRGYRKKEATA